MLQTDASDRGVGAVLSQLSDDGEEHPIGYYSRKLLPREERYSTVEKECLAIRLAVAAFRVYLLGRKFVYSDGPSFARVVGASERRKSKAMQMELGVSAVRIYHRTSSRDGESKC